MDSYQDLLKAQHQHNATQFSIESDAGFYWVIDGNKTRLARCFYEADANRIAKAMRQPHLTPVATALLDFVVMAENGNINPGPTANASTLGQWAALVRDGRSIVNSLKAQGAL